VTERADVAIVGLGAMGALSAWRLAARGANVIAFERFRPGHANGSSHGDTRIIRTAYFESPDYVPLVQRAWELWRSLEREAGADLLTETGGLMIGPREGGLVRAVLASAREHSLSHQLLDPREMRRRYPQHRLAADEVAVLESAAGFLRPEVSIAAAIARAVALGARCMTDTQVTKISAREGGGVVLETSRGRHECERALIAAGAWTPNLLPDLELPLTAERQVMAWLAVDDPAAFAPGRFPIFGHEVPGHGLRYGVPSTDGRSIKIGIHHDGPGVDPDTVIRDVGEADLEPLRIFARTLLSGVSGTAVGASVCLYTNAPDDRFIAASHPGLPGVTVLSACSGHGFKFAPVIGDLMADLLLEGTPPPEIIQTRLGVSA
jgi:sarcosine oxidase